MGNLSAKRIIAAAVAFIIAAVCHSPVNAASTGSQAKEYRYVALGDSIAAYYGVEQGEGYAEILAGKLKDEAGYGSVKLYNLAFSGDDTQDLLAKIAEKKYRDALTGADLITVSIGGNNFLGVLMENVTNSVGADMSSMMSAYGSLNISLPENMLEVAAAALLNPAIQTQFAAGIAQFAADLPKIVKELKTLAPKAKICFMTVYNPRTLDDPLYGIVKGLVTQVNGYLAKNAADGAYIIADTYSAFEKFDGDKLTLSAGGLDPHPNRNGHKLIADVHYTAITGTVSKNRPVYDATGAKDIVLTDAPLMRGEAIGLLIDSLAAKMGSFINISAIPITGTASFSDVPQTHPQYRQIMVAKTLGIISGTGSQKFYPDKPLTRQDYACIVNNYYTLFSKYGLVSPLTTGTGTYSDISQVAAYARESMLKIANAKLIKTENGKLNPLGSVSGLDMAVLIQ